MKYIKTYESTWDNPKLQELKKLLSHLIKVFNEMGYQNKNYFDRYKYEIQFYNNENVVDVRTFDIEGEFSKIKIFFSVIMRMGSINDDLVKFIPEYFKTINGLKLHSEHADFFTTTFEIEDDVDNIINQISPEDIKLKWKANKYNL